MTVKELRKYLFSGAKVKLIYNLESVFEGYANELPTCAFSEYHVNNDSICTVLSDNIIRIGISKPENEIPKEFDSYEIPARAADRIIRERIPIHITILGKFIHYYTGESRYNIRVESTGLFDNQSVDEYRTISDKELKDLYLRGKEDNK